MLLRVLDTERLIRTVQNGVLKLFTLSVNEQGIDAESETHLLASRMASSSHSMLSLLVSSYKVEIRCERGIFLVNVREWCTMMQLKD